MTEPPLPGGDEHPDLLRMAGQAVHDHPPGLHPIELITGTLQGFTSEQGQAVLADPDLLAVLTRHWRSRPPGPRLLNLAHTTDVRGQTHLRLLDRTGQLVRLTTKSRYGLAASTSGQPPELLVDDAQAHGTVVTRQVHNDVGLLDITIESEVSATGSFPVVALYSFAEGEPPTSRLLFLLTPAPADRRCTSHAESRLRVDPTLTSDRLHLFPLPVPADRLPADLLPLVTASVVAAKLPWKEAWRQAALSTPADHPLRAAVADGLTARP